MKYLLTLARGIDALNRRIGRAASWLVLAAVLLSAGNAVVRKAFDFSSNAFLEMQWYLFAALFLLCGGYALLRQEHVKIDLLYGRWSRRTQVWIDIAGTILFLLPFAGLLLALCWPYFLDAWRSGETSANAGGLVLWWVKLFMPLGFGLLGLQGLSELVKRIAWLRGEGPDPAESQAQDAELDPSAALRRGHANEGDAVQ
ncbi:MAG: TRAP transporter small permease subunit [Proteobacteria bacterium]|nr:TRAP transporter small permease subunit [Pseudomonadota bacterium]HQR04921.1 TRAP transporter small permease subunit [Rhodocyclaceae bacterium]